MSKTVLEIVNELFENNILKGKSTAELKIDLIKKELEGRMGDQQYHVFEKQEVVALFSKRNSYMYEVNEFNNYLNDLGILHKVATLSSAPEIEKFKNPTSMYVRFTPNKSGKINKEEVTNETTNLLKHLSNDQLIDLWLKLKYELEYCTQQYDLAKDEILIHPEIMSLDKKSIKTPFGTVSVLENKETYDNDAILNELGINYFLENAKVSMTKLEEYIIAGFISNPEIDKFRSISGVSTTFTIITMENLNKRSQAMDFKRRVESENLQELWNYEIN